MHMHMHMHMHSIIIWRTIMVVPAQQSFCAMSI